MCVAACFVGDAKFKGDLKDRQYVCSGVTEECRAGNLSWEIGWTSAAIALVFKVAQLVKCVGSVRVLSARVEFWKIV